MYDRRDGAGGDIGGGARAAALLLVRGGSGAAGGGDADCTDPDNYGAPHLSGAATAVRAPSTSLLLAASLSPPVACSYVRDFDSICGFESNVKSALWR